MWNTYKELLNQYANYNEITDGPKKEKMDMAIEHLQDALKLKPFIEEKVSEALKEASKAGFFEWLDITRIE